MTFEAHIRRNNEADWEYYGTFRNYREFDRELPHIRAQGLAVRTVTTSLCPKCGSGRFCHCQQREQMWPTYNGETLSWSIGLYFTTAEEERGYPRAKAVIAAMREHRPDQLARERQEMLKGSFDRMFGHNARKCLALIDNS